MIANLLKTLSGDTPIGYEDAKRLARHEDPDVRRQLAARQDLRPEILYFLAEDVHPDVRRQIAANVATPRHADFLLARDQDHGVREGLARKIAKLAPGLTADEQDKVRRMTYEALEILVRDQMTRVRQIISETLKDVANAPPDLIRRLARDVELVVAGPVLEFSPVLTDDDLLDIIANDPIHGALNCISRRSSVRVAVADAIVAAEDSAAIADLLANPSAQIREQTLDLILDRAPEHEAWHDPLVRRPRLPAVAATRLASFVARNLLELLSARQDLAPEVVDAVRAEVARRLEAAPDVASAEREETPYEAAQRLHAAGVLGEDAVAKALQEDELMLVTAALAVLADLSHVAVRRVVNQKSSKGVVALTWKAGLSMKLAEEIQRRVAAIPVPNVLKATPDGGFPLNEKEMEWQLAMFLDVVGEGWN